MDETDNKIIEYIKEYEKATSGVIAKELKINRSTISRHLQYLYREDCIEEFTEKGHSAWRIKEKKDASVQKPESIQKQAEISSFTPNQKFEFHMSGGTVIFGDQNIYNPKIVQLTKPPKESIPSEMEEWDNRAWLIIPKNYNDGKIVPNQVIEEYKRKIRERFGGSTIFNDVTGEYISKVGDVAIDNNLVLMIGYSRDDTQAGRAFLQELAKEIATDLGQESVTLMFDKAINKFVKAENQAGGDVIDQFKPYNYPVEERVKPSKVTTPLPIRPKPKRFVGRKAELDSIINKLDANNLAVAVGIAGIGKTYIGAELADEFDDGSNIFWFDFMEKERKGFDLLARYLGVFFQKNGDNELINYLDTGGLNESDKRALIVSSMRKRRYYLFLDNYQEIKDEDTKKLLDEILQKNDKSMVMVMTRTRPVFLPRGLDRNYLVDVEKMSFEDAKLLLNNIGIDSEGYQKKIWNETGGHPKAMELYSSFCRLDKRDVIRKIVRSERSEIRVLFKNAYSCLNEDAQEVLTGISVFSEYVPLEAIEFLINAYEDSQEENVEKEENKELIENALSELEDWRLVKFDENRIIMHSLIQEYAYDSLEDKEDYHALAAEYYRSIEKTPENILNVYYHLDKAGLKDEGIEFLRYEGCEIIRRQGYWWEYIAKLKEIANYLNKKGEIEKVGYTYNELGYILDLLGEPAQALKYYKRALQKAEELKEEDKIATCHNNIGMIYANRGDLNKADEYFKKALKIGEELGDKSDIATASNNIGMIYHNRSDLDKALEYYQKALKSFDVLGDKSNIATASNNIGSIYKARGDLDEALEYFKKALKIDEEMGDKVGIALRSNNIGMIYKARGDLDSALDHYQKALKIDKELDDKAGIATRINNIGSIYHDRGDLDKAFDHYQKALKIDEELGDKAGIALRSNNIGMIYHNRGDLDKALEYYQKSLGLLEELGDKSHMAICYCNIASIHEENNNLDKALEFFERSLELYIPLGNPNDIIESYENLIRGYTKKGDVKKAKDYEKKFAEFKKKIGFSENE